MNYNKDNSCFICHKCLHTFFLKSDLERHLHKKEVCDSAYNCLLSLEEIRVRSLNKRYYFSNNIINPLNLEIYQLIHLVNNFDKKLNIIYSLIDLSMQNTNEKQNISQNDLSNIDLKNHIVMIDGKKNYKCLNCSTVYKRKESLISHIYNKDLCDRNKGKNQIIGNDLINGQIEDNKLTHSYTTVIQNGNNIQNANNIQNNTIQNNNAMQNNYNVKMNDFIENNYSHSHIPFDLVKNKDFYLYKNFLSLLLENDENKNIYFDGKYAYVYSDGALKRIQNDKAGCLILEKLDKTMKSYIYSNPRCLNNDYSYVNKYYSVTRNKYVNDTIYKPYNPDTRSYDYCETNNIRTRDKCLSDITQVCNMYKEKTKQIMKDKECDKYEIDTNYQVNIPFYESAKMRNKAFLENDKYY